MTDDRFERLFKSFMSHAPAQWWLKDEAGTYVFVNASFCNFWRKDEADVLGRSDIDLMPAALAQSLSSGDRTVIQTDRPLNTDESVMTPDGLRKRLLMWRFPFAENGNRYVGGIAFDVTERYELERELEAARDKAIESAALKRAFVSSMQHEIRTPLAGIIGMNELLLMTDLDENQRQLAQTVQKSSEALLSVLNDVLDLSKIESGALRLRQIPFSLRFVVEESARLVKAAAQYKHLDLKVEMDESLPPLVVGDPERLRQVLLNMLSNAVKFTTAGFVHAGAQLMHSDDELFWIRFSVADSGIGIDPEKLPYLFVPFWQADMSDTRRYGGVGLGLPLSKFLVERMGSPGIKVISQPDKGSTFSFDIPFRTKADQQTDPAALQPDVLIVEDNIMLRGVILNQLANLGVAGEIAGTYGEALSLFAANRYRLVLCERASGLAKADKFIAEIRKLEATHSWSRTAVAVLSPVEDGTDRERMLAAGADYFIKKPISTEHLWKLLNSSGIANIA